MKDADFKDLRHLVGSNHIHSLRSTVSPGYKPDLTVVDSKNCIQFILESEQKTDRKAFLGDFIKAEHYAESSGSTPELVIVLQEFANTTVLQIADHLRPYVKWLRDLKGGTLNLSAIHVISDSDYLDSIAHGELLGSAAFKLRGYTV